MEIAVTWDRNTVDRMDEYGAGGSEVAVTQ